MLFKAQYNEDNEVYTVYAVRYDRGTTKFLVYGNGRWLWIEDYKFVPVE